MATKRKRKGGSKKKSTHAKSGTAAPKRKKRRKGRAAAPAAAPKKRTKKRKARKSNPRPASKSAAPKKRAKRRKRKSNPRKPAEGAMHGKEPLLRAKTRKKTRGMKRVSKTTKYKSRNKRGAKRVYSVTKHFPNPIGNVKNVVVLGIGTLIGYEFTDAADRWVATMSPSNAPHAWYGADAAHRIMARPNGMRMLTQVGIAALFFGGSVLAAKRYPMIAYGLAGGFIGSVVHFGHQMLSQRVWPALSSAEKGNERVWGNRLYPAEQGKLMDLQDKAIEVQDKAVVDAKDAVAAMPAGMQDGPTKGNLPDAYLYPTTITYSRRVTRTNGAPELPAPPPRVREAELRAQPGRQPATVGRSYEGEPQARPRSTLSCGGCGGCTECTPMVEAGGRVRTAPQQNRDQDRRTGTPPENQPCTDVNGNASVRDASGACIQLITTRDGGNGGSGGNGGGSRISDTITAFNPPATDCPECPPAGGPPAERGGGTLPGPSREPDLITGSGVNLARPTDTAAGAPRMTAGMSMETLASGGSGPHSTSSLLPTP